MSGLPLLKFGPFVLDRSECRLLRDGLFVALQPKALDLLRHFAERPGVLVTREELLREVWPDVTVSDQALSQMLHRVRNALGEGKEEPVYLQTVPKRGYRFVAQVIEEAQAPAAPPPALFGREALLQRLRAALIPGALVTLHGPGGIGKSALARALGADVFVDLERTSDALHAVASALGVPLPPGADKLDRIAVRAGGAPLRVVLDGAEGSVPLLIEALPRWTGRAITWLVTSRIKLELPEEVVFEVPPLDGAAGAALYRERASRRGWTGVVDELAVQALVSRLDGSPLALELAAARVELLPAEQLLQRLDDRLRLLRSAQGGLEAVVEGSWGLLSEAERAACSALSTFASSFRLDDACVLLGPDGIDTVQALIRHALVQSVPRAARPLRLPETVRLYARARLQERPDAASLLDAHARHVLSCAHQAGVAYDDSPQAHTLDAMLAWTEDLRAIARRSQEDPDRAARAALLLVMPARATSADLFLELAPSVTPRVTEPELKARLLRSHAWFARRTGRLPDALSMLDEAAALASQPEIAHDRAAVLADLGRTDEATALLGAAAESARAEGDRKRLVGTCVTLASVWWAKGDRARARPLLDEALAVGEGGGCDDAYLVALMHVALHAQEQGRYAEAEVYAQDALLLAQTQGASSVAASLRSNLANLALESGQPALYERRLGEALEAATALGDRSLVRTILGNRAVARLYAGDLQAAEAGLRETQGHARVAGHARHLAWTDINLGTVARLRGRLDLAEVHWARALETAQSAGLARHAAVAAAWGCAAAASRGDLERAQLLLERAQSAGCRDGFEAELVVAAAAHLALARGEGAPELLARLRVPVSRFPEVKLAVDWLEARQR